MTSTENDPSVGDVETVDDPNSLHAMRHPDLGDVLQIPAYAVPLREEMGYELVSDHEDAVEQAPAALPAPTPAATTRATTSGTAKTPGSDGGQPAATPAV